MIEISSNNEIFDAIYFLQDQGYSFILITGRVYVIEGDIQMADQFQSVDEHYFKGKDVTKYVIANMLNLGRGQQKDAFDYHINNDLRTRTFRFHKDERYIRFSSH